MPTDIALITPYFNFNNFESLRTNFHRFRDALTYPVTAVELSLNGRFQCATEANDIRINGDARSIMFQRSRLVNLAIRRLPTNITKVAWVDSDVLFDDPEWLDKLSEKLNTVQVAQPFRMARYLDANDQVVRARPSWCSIIGTGQDRWASSRGYAWGARIDALPQIPMDEAHVGLLDRQLISEDTVMAMSWAGFGLGGDVRDISQTMEAYCRQWSGTRSRRVAGFLDGGVSHLYHGAYQQQHKEDREYLSQIKYDPYQDLQIDQTTGAYKWAPTRDRAIVYFLSTMLARDCDSHLPKLIPKTAAPTLPSAVAAAPLPPPLVQAAATVNPPKPKVKAPYKPTVTIITPGLGLGGAEQWIRALVTYCTNINWVVGVLSTDYWHPLVAEPVIQHAEVHSPLNITAGVTPHASIANVIKASVERANAVIVWGGGDYWPLPTIAPIVFVGHGTCQWTSRAAAQALAGGARYATAVSGLSAKTVATVFPDVTTIWNGVDENRLRVPEDRKAVRAVWEPHAYDYTRYVGYLGRLGNEKNLDSIIHAVAALPFWYHLCLIGCAGWKQDRILPLARTLLPERLVEIPATDDIGIPLGGLDCMVQVTPREGHSLAICEGMLCRVPIVSTRVGAIPELEERAGRELVESVPLDPVTYEIANAIRKVCTDFPLERIDAAEEFARKHLTATVMCAEWERYLLRIINQNAAKLGTE